MAHPSRLNVEKEALFPTGLSALPTSQSHALFQRRGPKTNPTTTTKVRDWNRNGQVQPDCDDSQQADQQSKSCSQNWYRFKLKQVLGS